MRSPVYSQRGCRPLSNKKRSSAKESQVSRIVIGPENAGFVEELYELWKDDAGSVSADWDRFFREESGRSGVDEQSVSTVDAGDGGDASDTGNTDYRSTYVYKQGRVDSLVWAHRDVGYLNADLNPLHGYLTQDLWYLSKTIEGNYENLDLESFGLDESDLDTEFRSGRSMVPAHGTLREILAALKSIYSSYMGVEVLHIQNRTMRGWLIERIEQNNNQPSLGDEKRKAILQDVIKAQEFEQFIHANYIGQKRFSLEGGESLIPALHALIDTAAEDLGIQEIVVGMAHRGRLNVLTNLMNKPEKEIFSHFEEKILPHEVGGSGDVKYHLGFSTDHQNEDGTSVHVSLVANPSHLEAVDPVVQGKARGVQRRRHDTHRKKVIPVLIHGDSAFTGQGVVSETFNLSQLRGYKTGGTVHIIVNNQIGFTTASRDSRSTFFCTDVAKAMPVPIFHVNGDHPEYVVRAIELALRFRQKFGYDAVVDIVCYRKFGHNEADEPSFTHPKMYRLIERAESVAKIHGRELDAAGVYSTAEQDVFRNEYRAYLKESLQSARNDPIDYVSDGFTRGEWKGYAKAYDHSPVETGVDRATLVEIGNAIISIPDGFGAHRKLTRILDAKRKTLESGVGLDWATAEALAFGSLVLEGFPIRLSGEDSGRGTFSHRHAVWWDTATDQPEPYTPLKNLSPDQARFGVYDSPLSEFSVLGFEYGNALAQPDMLTIWEAQFGDFVNGGQVIIDQFIVAGESKWDRGSGLVLLLPHGYEGQGPEHSSAHLERFLQLCAEDNIQVVNVTTPAQYFHLLRRQMKRSFRKPLILMAPKSLLRSKDATSRLDEFVTGNFLEVLDDPALPHDAERVVFCSGKLYYDLRSRRSLTGSSKTAIVRVEQFYPFPANQLMAVLSRYEKHRELIWAQEEPKNRGGWSFMHERAARFCGGKPLLYCGRKASASPATGSHTEHLAELEEILGELFR